MGKQKRSENTYQKINTIFYRDANNIIMPYDELVSPEFEWLRNCKFDAEEKIDGTNIRIEVSSIWEFESDDILNYIEAIVWEISYKGKTDSAIIPPKLEKYLKETFTEDKILASLGLSKRMEIYNKDNTLSQEIIDKNWVKTSSSGKLIFDINKVPNKFTLYGEGYGAGIQSGGYYRSDNSFIGFDVKVDDLYLLREQRDEIFNKLGADIVPYIGQFTVDEAIEFVKRGFNSRISEKEHLAEGLVLRTPMGLTNRRGERIIFKVKTCDWVKYFNKYGTYDKVEQVKNKFLK